MSRVDGGPSRAAIEAARGYCACVRTGGQIEAGPAGATYSVPCDHRGALERAEATLRRAHDPALGLDRSVRLGDVVEALREMPSEWSHDGMHGVAAFLERKFGS